MCGHKPKQTPITKHHHQDDWAPQVSRMRRAALAWRLKQLQQGDGGDGVMMEVVNGDGGKKR